jgi:hypothetical protein
MAIINTNGSFGPSDTVTNTTLNSVADAATFDDPVDETTLELITSGPDDGKLRIKTGGVDTNQIAGSAVTKAKIEDVANMKVLGNTSGSATAPQEVSVLDEDDMNSDSATALATQQSIKSYVDNSSTDGFSPTTYAGGESVTLPNGLIMKFGTVTAGATGTAVSFASAFPTAAIWASACPNSSDSLTQSTGYSGKASVDSLSTSGVNVSCDGSAYWQAIGY